MLAEETAGPSFCFVTLYDLPYGPDALHRNVLLCKKKQIITTEKRNASPAACYLKKKVWWSGMLNGLYSCTLLGSGRPAAPAHATESVREAMNLSHVTQLGRKSKGADCGP